MWQSGVARAALPGLGVLSASHPLWWYWRVLAPGTRTVVQAVPPRGPTHQVLSRSWCRVTNTRVPVATKCDLGLGGAGHCQVQAEPTPDSSGTCQHGHGDLIARPEGGEQRTRGRVLVPPVSGQANSAAKAAPRQSQAKTFSDALLHLQALCSCREQLPCGAGRGSVPTVVRALAG